MAKQFDLEQQILACWNITSDLDVLFENAVENRDLTMDEVSNIVLGLQQLYELKFDKLFRTFEQFVQEYYAATKANDVDDDFFTPDMPDGVGDDQTENIRRQYHEELSGLSDDELVRKIRQEYQFPDEVGVSVTYKD